MVTSSRQTKQTRESRTFCSSHTRQDPREEIAARFSDYHILCRVGKPLEPFKLYLVLFNAEFWYHTVQVHAHTS